MSAIETEYSKMADSPFRCAVFTYAADELATARYKGHITVIRLDSDDNRARADAKMLDEPERFVGVFDRNIPYNDYRDDCFNVIKELMGHNRTSQPVRLASEVRGKKWVPYSSRIHQLRESVRLRKQDSNS